jgi:hypothetical protein
VFAVSERRIDADRWRVIRYSAVAIVLLAAFPRLEHALRWRTRLSARGVVASIAFNTALGFAVRGWLVPFFRRMEEKRTEAEEELRKQLGREPTEKELFAHLGTPAHR